MSIDSPSAEVYDPDTDHFEVIPGAPPIVDAYDQPWPVRLRDGKVLIARGAGRKCFIFDSDTNTFSPFVDGPKTIIPQGSPREVGVQMAPDGRVFVIGGITEPIYTPTADIWVYDPSKGARFEKFASSLSVPREAPGTALLRDGRILVIGGVTAPSGGTRTCSDNFSVTDTVDIIDPVSDTVAPFLGFPDINWTLSVATLGDGSMIAVGGLTCGGSKSFPYIYYIKGFPSVL